MFPMLGPFETNRKASIKLAIYLRQPIYLTGRGGEIRTPDPLHPMQVRYQAALRPEGANYSRALRIP